MNEDNKMVECSECGYIHAWSERVKKYDPEYYWTYHFCPKCGEESYYPVEQEQSDIKE
jgi:hypothetical protein|nr:MAG TPA: cysteine-rich protein [Caudoviricetes sp.]